MSRSRSIFLAPMALLAFAATASVTGDLPDPYRPVENWAQLPAGIQWGQVIAVKPDAHGNIWVFHRAIPQSWSLTRPVST